TRTDSSQTSSLLAQTYLPHFDADPELVRKLFDELTEIDAFVGRIIKGGLGSIALKFNIADFHFQTEFFGDLSGSDHDVVFSLTGMLPYINVFLRGFAVYFWNFSGVGIRFFLPHLHFDQF